MDCQPLQRTVITIVLLQASLKRKREEVGEEKAEAIKTHVKVNLDMKEQEEVATTDAKTQVRLKRARLRSLLHFSGAPASLMAYPPQHCLVQMACMLLTRHVHNVSQCKGIRCNHYVMPAVQYCSACCPL